MINHIQLLNGLSKSKSEALEHRLTASSAPAPNLSQSTVLMNSQLSHITDPSTSNLADEGANPFSNLAAASNLSVCSAKSSNTTNTPSGNRSGAKRNRKQSVPQKLPTTNNSRKRRKSGTSSQQQTKLDAVVTASPKESHSYSTKMTKNNNNSKINKPVKTSRQPRISDCFTSLKPKLNIQPISPPQTLSTLKSQQKENLVIEQQHELDSLRSRNQFLEKDCADKEERLRAVSNNQTILHSTLKAAIITKEKTIEGLHSKAEESLLVMEKLVRSESVRESDDLRQKVASDGARLGRVVYTRAGMHTVESWEDGYASKSLKNRAKNLLNRKSVMELRQKEARKAVKFFSDSIESHFSKSNQQKMQPPPRVPLLGSSKNDSFPAVAGRIISDALEAVEEEEAVRMHLLDLKKEENDLLEQERALDMEKAIHIQALKRMANEDASRFKSRPKLHNRYVLTKLLGRGGFSEVWQAYDLIEFREVAVKIHQLDPRWSDSKKENYTKHVSREYEIHRDVRHPRIVSFFDVFEIDNNSFATVLECCKGTDLDTLLKERKTLNERDARAILIQILTGMRYLSQPSKDGSRQGIIHYDLKPGNILFDDHGDVKITDFGLSKIVDEAESGASMELTSQGAGTYWYLPPECFMTNQNVRISNKVDVWSIGVIYFQMLFGKRPFGDGQSQDRVLSNGVMLNAREVTFPEKPPVSKEGKIFIQTCLAYDQILRPTISELCENSYLFQKKL